MSILTLKDELVQTTMESLEGDIHMLDIKRRMKEAAKSKEWCIQVSLSDCPDNCIDALRRQGLKVSVSEYAGTIVISWE